MNTNLFSAEEPTLGYLYQINYSLLLLLQSSEVENAKIGIEKLDDIQIEEPNYTNLYQTKYHLNSVANLTDRSADFWKTIRVWCEGISDKSIDVETTNFHLITTSIVSSGNIPFEFTKAPKYRKVDDIITGLEEIAQETSNQLNKQGYVAFNALDRETKKKLIDNIYILDASVDINEIKGKIIAELRKTVIDVKVPPFYERLLGWYLSQVILHLRGEIEYITFNELQSKNFEIIDSLKIDNLPADFPVPLELSSTDLSEFKKRNFVKQLELVGVNEKVMKSAISDYHRAYEQRSKWVRDALISPSDEMNYEIRLHDDWKRKFEVMAGDCESGEDIAKLTAGKNFYTNFYVLAYPRIFIKERFDHVYMVTGSCHILSDSKKIGWHPDYDKNC